MYWELVILWKVTRSCNSLWRVPLERGLLVGVMTLDLAGSSQAVYKLKYNEILHCSEGGNLEQVAQYNNFLCLWLPCVWSLQLSRITCIFVLSLYILMITWVHLIVYTLLIKKVTVHLNSLLRWISRRSSQPFTGYTILFLGCKFILLLVKYFISHSLLAITCSPPLGDFSWHQSLVLLIIDFTT